jgi:hypothetical protein
MLGVRHGAHRAHVTRVDAHDHAHDHDHVDVDVDVNVVVVEQAHFDTTIAALRSMFRQLSPV